MQFECRVNESGGERERGEGGGRARACRSNGVKNGTKTDEEGQRKSATERDLIYDSRS